MTNVAFNVGYCATRDYGFFCDTIFISICTLDITSYYNFRTRANDAFSTTIGQETMRVNYEPRIMRHTWLSIV